MAGDADFRPWNELFPDVLGLIFGQLDEEEILGVIPLVCKSWCKVVEGPYCWQTIDTYSFIDYMDQHDKVRVEKVLRALIPRSSESLRELYVPCPDDDMLSFIAEYVGSVEKLDISFNLMNESTFEQFATKLGSLTKLSIRSNNGMSQLTLQAIAKNCKRLVSLSWEDEVDDSYDEDDVDAVPIPIPEEASYDAADCFVCSMPKLKRLSLRYSLLKSSYFFSLLSGSPELEWVEIRGLKLDPGVVKERYPNIETLVLDNLPVDSDIDEPDGMDGFEWDYFSDADSYDEYGGHVDYRGYDDEYDDLYPF